MKTNKAVQNMSKQAENHLQTLPNNLEESKWMTRKEVMAHTHLGWWSIRRLILDEILPCYGKRKNILFKREEVDAAIEATRVQVV